MPFLLESSSSGEKSVPMKPRFDQISRIRMSSKKRFFLISIVLVERSSVVVKQIIVELRIVQLCSIFGDFFSAKFVEFVEFLSDRRIFLSNSFYSFDSFFHVDNSLKNVERRLEILLFFSASLFSPSNQFSTHFFYRFIVKNLRARSNEFFSNFSTSFKVSRFDGASETLEKFTVID